MQSLKGNTQNTAVEVHSLITLQGHENCQSMFNQAAEQKH